MNAEQLKSIEQTIAQSIESNVNGKIRTLTQEFREYKVKMENYIENDEKWKSEADPYIKGLSNVSGGAKILVWFAVGVSAVIASFLAVQKLFI